MNVPGLLWMLLLMLHINPVQPFVSLPVEGTHKVKTFKHPFYISVTEFNHNPREKTLETSCKMFADDFESTLKTLNKTNVDITHPKDPKQVEKYIFDYIQKHLQLKINGKQVTFQFIGYEKEEESVWVYLQVNNVPVARKIEVTNNILYESYNTQISIMHAAVSGTRKSTRLVFPDTNASFDFN